MLSHHVCVSYPRALYILVMWPSLGQIPYEAGSDPVLRPRSLFALLLDVVGVAADATRSGRRIEDESLMSRTVGILAKLT
jgi:hypothetical protein